MSEYQYYDFYSIDSELSEKAREEIASWSSRTNPTLRRATFTYSYSDFPKDERAVLIKYFDAFLYMANWGEKRLMFKIPKNKLGLEEIKQFNTNRIDDFETEISIYSKSKYIIIEISNYEEEGSYIENETSYLMELSSLRGDVINEDYRFLFVIWLNVIKNKILHEELNPDFRFESSIIPEGLGNLNSGLSSFISFFQIDEDWIIAVQEAKKKSLASGENKIVFADLFRQVDEQIMKRRALEKKKERRDFLKRKKTVEANKEMIKPEIRTKKIR